MSQLKTQTTTKKPKSVIETLENNLSSDFDFNKHVEEIATLLNFSGYDFNVKKNKVEFSINNFTINIRNGQPFDGFSDEMKNIIKNNGVSDNVLYDIVIHESENGSMLLTFVQCNSGIDETNKLDVDISYFTVDTDNVNPQYVDFIMDLQFSNSGTIDNTISNIDDVFSVEEVTNTFYTEFGSLFRDELQHSIKINGKEALDVAPQEEVNKQAQLVVNRLLFLLFIEQKGWLDGNKKYIEETYEKISSKSGEDVYNDFFKGLFFESLASSKNTNSVPGTIPYLNGGLFKSSEIKLDNRNTVSEEENIYIEESFFDELLDEENGLLRQYKIVLSESNPSEQELVVDPEFVGKIFEMFMNSDKRSEMGAFYTPKEITVFMVQNALKDYLTKNTDESKENISNFITTKDTDNLEHPIQVENEIKTIRIVDPSVGSGAFIISTLEQLCNIRQSFVDDENTYELKQSIISNNLFGVDLDSEALSICKFRVWLHLIQDLEVEFEEFVQNNNKYALPNIGLNFYCGNAIIGDTTPAEGADRQETLEMATNDTLLTDFEKARNEYFYAHEDKKQKRKKFEQLKNELNQKTHIDHVFEDAKNYDDSFVWTNAFPQVFQINSGFDIVIGNPPYEGASQQYGIKKLSQYYSETHSDMYETIPGMRYDLYQKFIMRGYELTKTNGVVSYITSDTFFTIGSKKSTRNILQNNELTLLIDANNNIFNAAVNPAIFSFIKTKNHCDNEFLFVDGTETDIDKYRLLIDPSIEENDNVNVKTVSTKKMKQTIQNVFYYPNEENKKLADNIIIEANDPYEKWKTTIANSSTIEENKNAIKENHHNKLKSGDITLLGLLTAGGQGLATGNNDEYIAYLDDTPSANKLKEKNGESFEYGVKNEKDYYWMSRVIKQESIVQPSDLTDDEKINGIEKESWVPIVKGKGDRYYSPVTEVINWSKNSKEKIRESGHIRNEQVYFKEGIFAVGQGTGNVTVRYVNNCIIEHSGNMLIPFDDRVTTKYLIALLNSKFIDGIINNFINHTVNTQVSDFRKVPVIIPNKNEKEKLELLVDEMISAKQQLKEFDDPAIDVSYDLTNRSVEQIQNDIDKTVEEVYLG